MRSRAFRGRLMAAALVLAALVASPLHRVYAEGEPTDLTCRAGEFPTLQKAKDLLANKYAFFGHPAVVLPADLTWREDPFKEDNWLFQFQSLKWSENLWFGFVSTADQRFLDRYLFLLRDWAADNPFASPRRSGFSWDEHAAALRGTLYACAVRRVGPGIEWLRSAAFEHGQVLAREDFYVGRGNHALNQSIGLLDLSCALGQLGWRELAVRRMEALVLENVDRQGVSNEQSEGYQAYNYQRYLIALARMRACGVEPSPAVADRIDRMTDFLTFSTQPNGRTTMLGDTNDGSLRAYPGTEEEFSATSGRSGVRPTRLHATYSSGYAFFRSGWGTHRRFTDETAVSVRFGPGRRLHGHNDQASVTMYSLGDRVLLDTGGPYGYKDNDPRRVWIVSERAHNTVSADGMPVHQYVPTLLKGERHTADFDFVSLEHRKLATVLALRRVFYSRTLNVLVVDDELSAPSPRTFRQWWHLHSSASPRLSTEGFESGRPGGPNVRVRQLVRTATQRIHVGERAPLQGWWSPTYGRFDPAPSVEGATRGSHVRFVTLIVPSGSGRVRGTVEAFRLLPRGFDLTMSLGGRTERMVVRDDWASAAPVAQ